MTSLQTRFEKWAKEDGYGLQRLPSGDYYNTTTMCAWLGWKAAHESISAEIEKLTRFDMGTLTFYDDSIETIVEDVSGDYVLRYDVKEIVESA